MTIILLQLIQQLKIAIATTAHVQKHLPVFFKQNVYNKLYLFFKCTSSFLQFFNIVRLMLKNKNVAFIYLDCLVKISVTVS